MKTTHACTALLWALAVAAPAWAQAPGPMNAITDVPGVEVGQFTGTDNVSSTGGSTGTTVVLVRSGATPGVTQRGGSAYGLAAADGVMQCLGSQGIGKSVAPGQIVPLVPAAILFDPGRCAPFNYRPDASFGLRACQAANGGPIQMGNVGAGAGARSGGVKGGLGTASTVLPNGIIVGAIVAINSSGRTFDANGNFFAGFLELGNEFDTVLPGALPPAQAPTLLQNTTIAVVATTATLTKPWAPSSAGGKRHAS